MRDQVRNLFARAVGSHELRRWSGMVARVWIGCIIGRMVHIACLESWWSGMMEEPGSEGPWMVVQGAQATAARDKGVEWKS